jgi:hypothetical protein
VDTQDVQTVEEILAEFPLLHPLLQVPVGRREDSDVDGKVLRAAQTLDLSFLDDPEKLDLEMDGKLADLVEKKRPA